MTDLENYSVLINSIFGPGTATFSTSKSTSNNVIGALNFIGDYDEFKRNFTARLKRIKDIYSGSPNFLEKILIPVNEIASSKNWQGAFAELAAFDHLNNDLLVKNNFLLSPIEPEVNLPKENSFALEAGKMMTNVDGYIKSFDLFFDIKVLKDNAGEILEGIYKEVQAIYCDLVIISAEYDLDVAYGVIKEKRKALLHELNTALEKGKKPKYLRSEVITNLSFVLTWKRGVSTAIRTYSPFLHAENHHANIFIYANKFLKDHPTLIVLVSLPWYNQVLNRKDNDAFFRSYARRVFCQYKKDDTLFKKISPKFSGTQSIYEVSTYLSGIIFLEDNTILSKEPDSTNVKSSVYLNPNAKNPLKGSMSNGYLHKVCNNAFDNFEYDNY